MCEYGEQDRCQKKENIVASGFEVWNSMFRLLEGKEPRRNPTLLQSIFSAWGEMFESYYEAFELQNKREEMNVLGTLEAVVLLLFMEAEDLEGKLAGILPPE